MSEQTDWVGEPTAVSARSISNRYNPQSRILVRDLLTKAGEQGVLASDLIEAVVALGLTVDGAKGRLGCDKNAGLIFAKGAYITRGVTYRYFLTREWCDAYVFEVSQEEAQTKADRNRERERERWVQRKASETPEQRAERRERERVRNWTRQGLEAPPPQVKSRQDRRDMTREERLAADRERQREKREKLRAERIAQGLPVGSRKTPGGVKKRKKTESRPGKQLVVVLPGTEAPVKASRFTLVGDPVITSETRVTIAPVARDYRFWVDPATVRPVFGAMRVGSYIDEEQAA